MGLIADTRGLLRPEVSGVFADVDLIIHAGDVGRETILEALERLAPVQAVRGNVDRGKWADRLPPNQLFQLGGVSFCVYHGHAELGLDPAAAGYNVVIKGHSHKPEIQKREGVLFLNPGSAGPRRFKMPVTVMRLYLKGKSVRPELIHLVLVAPAAAGEEPSAGGAT